MRYEKIADIYSAHEKVREGFLAATDGVSDHESGVLPDGEKWSVRHIAEHVSMVEAGMARICSRLIEKARTDGDRSDGSVVISPEFGDNIASVTDKKLEAPEVVIPTGNIAISDAVAALRSSTSAINDMRGDLESLDLSGHTFRHPYFGELTAVEWLIVRNGHERRHTIQIEKLLRKIRE